MSLSMSPSLPVRSQAQPRVLIFNWEEQGRDTIMSIIGTKLYNRQILPIYCVNISQYVSIVLDLKYSIKIVFEVNIDFSC